MQEIKGYKCDFCNYKKFTVKTLKKHESICFYNPENKTCGSCFYNDYGNCLNGLKKQGELPILLCKDWINKEEIF